MKLYTLIESELLKVISDAQTYPKEEWNDFEILEALDLTPIELPSDEEIKENADKYTIDNNTYYSFINGAMWLKYKYLTKTNNL